MHPRPLEEMCLILSVLWLPPLGVERLARAIQGHHQSCEDCTELFWAIATSTQMCVPPLGCTSCPKKLRHGSPDTLNLGPHAICIVARWSCFGERHAVVSVADIAGNVTLSEISPVSLVSKSVTAHRLVFANSALVLEDLNYQIAEWLRTGRPRRFLSQQWRG